MAEQAIVINNNPDNVSTGAPLVGGYGFVAPVGTTLPTDAVTELNAAFVSTGFISEDGVENENSPETNVIKDWGGSEVLKTQTGRPDRWKVTFIESKNPTVLKIVKGENNVTGTLADGMTVKTNNAELEEHSYVFEMLMNKNVKRRVVIPRGAVVEVATVTLNSSDAIGYEVTIAAQADASGNTNYDYYKQLTA